MHFKDFLLRPKEPLVFGTSVSSLNLQSSAANTKSSSFSLFFNGNEKIYTSIRFDVFVGLIPRYNEDMGKYRPVHRWSVTKSYDEIKEFLKFLINDPKLCYDGSGSNRRGAPILQRHIPNEVSNKLTDIIALFPVDDVCSLNGNAQDVMELLEHKENIDKTMQEVMKFFNCIKYGPLYQFLDCPIYMKDFLHNCVFKIQRFARRYFKKGNLNLCLHQHYHQELQEFITLLEGGIPVYDINSSENVYHYNASLNTYGFATRKSGAYKNSKMPCILWLDVSHDDQALGRICIGTKDVFQSSRNNQDSRLANGIFLADIADIRRGISSIALKNSKCIWLEPSLVVSISGAERCLNFQFPRSSAIGRNRFIELLRLLAIQGLTEVELHLRRRKWRRIHNGISHLQKGIKQPDASRIISLFRKGILIEEEIYSPTVGSQSVQRLMLYNEENHTLSFTEVLDRANEDRETDFIPTTDNVKCVNIDDIAEIRPGKFSYTIDGEELPLITIISSEYVIALPVANISQRNGVLKKFQDFVLYLQDTTLDFTDTPTSFTNEQMSSIPESISEKNENSNSIHDIDLSTLSPTKSTTSNITAPVNTRHLSVSMTRSISQTRRNSNLLDAGRDSREYDSFSRARESSMSNRSSISELEFIE